MTEYKERFETLDTNVVHAGAPRPNIEGAVVTPVSQSANFLMAAEGELRLSSFLGSTDEPWNLL